MKHIQRKKLAMARVTERNWRYGNHSKRHLKDIAKWWAITNKDTISHKEKVRLNKEFADDDCWSF